MEKEDIFEEVIEIGKSRGRLTYAEINDIASDYLSTDEFEELMDLLLEVGVEVVDNQETDVVTDISEDEVAPSEGGDGYEKTEDIVQTYFIRWEIFPYLQEMKK